MAGKGTQWRFVGRHPEALDDDRMMAAGDAVKLTDKEMQQPTAARLIAEGQLLPMTRAAANKRSADV